MNRLYRSRTDSKLTGLCGGLAAYFGIDATIVRLAMVIGGLFSLGTVLMIYIIAAVVVPKEPGIEGFYSDNPYR